MNDTAPQPVELRYPVWTIKGFVDEFVRIHQQMPERAFAFILGAGASRSSGIPTGTELVDYWLEDIFERNVTDGQDSLAEWIVDNIYIDEFDYASRDEFYPEIYKRRFRTDPASGQAYLEDIMRRAEPAFGYTILARLLTETRHNAVITTNFDNLVADAIFIYTDAYPLVCGHELLADFVRIPLRRPLIAKIHRDLLYDPKNSRSDIAELSSAWKDTIKRLLQYYTPVFIGYGGNDGSLMGFLKDFDTTLPGGIYWCYAGDGAPKPKIEEVLRKHNGVLVCIQDFDELMFRIGEGLGLDLLTIRTIKNRADKRYEGYLRHILRMTEKNSTIGNKRGVVFEKILEGLSDKEKSGLWWYWENKARNTVSLEEQEAVFRQGLKACPNNAQLHSHFANFLTDTRKNITEAAKQHKKALKIDPHNPTVLCNYAVFCAYSLQSNRDAEIYFKKALNLAEKDQDDDLHYKYASFLARNGKTDDATIKRHFKTAIFKGPKNCLAFANYAWWLLSKGKWLDASPLVSRTLKEVSLHMYQLRCELFLYKAIISQLRAKDDTLYLTQIKSILKTSFPKVGWDLKDALKSLEDAKNLSNKQKFYEAICDAIMDDNKQKDLNKFPQWNHLAE